VKVRCCWGRPRPSSSPGPSRSAHPGRCGQGRDGRDATRIRASSRGPDFHIKPLDRPRSDRFAATSDEVRMELAENSVVAAPSRRSPRACRGTLADARRGSSLRARTRQRDQPPGCRLHASRDGRRGQAAGTRPAAARWLADRGFGRTHADEASGRNGRRRIVIESPIFLAIAAAAEGEAA
jgi:hypothetical protein